jgi:hypothetical protein
MRKEVKRMAYPFRPIRKKIPEKLHPIVKRSLLIIRSSKSQKESGSETVKLLPVINPPPLEENHKHPGT